MSDLASLRQRVEELEGERDRRVEQVRRLQDGIEEVDRAAEQLTDKDGWIVMYRLPQVGPWHRLLAASRAITTGRALDKEEEG